MTLYPHWKEILKKSWCLRFNALALIFLLAQSILPYFSDLIPRETFVLLFGLSIVGSTISRLVFQVNI